MSKELVISSSPHETRVAILEDDQLAEIYIERSSERALAGSIYKGRVSRVLPGMQSAFVKIGIDRDAFLYVSDVYDETADIESGALDEDGDEIVQVPKARALEPSEPAATPNEPAAKSETPAESRGGRRERRDERDGRGRRGRRRKGPDSRFPDRKYASFEGPSSGGAAAGPVGHSPQQGSEETVGPDALEDDEFIVLPGESLAKYRGPVAGVEQAPLESANEDEDEDGGEEPGESVAESRGTGSEAGRRGRRRRRGRRQDAVEAGRTSEANGTQSSASPDEDEEQPPVPAVAVRDAGEAGDHDEAASAAWERAVEEAEDEDEASEEEQEDFSSSGARVLDVFGSEEDDEDEEEAEDEETLTASRDDDEEVRASAFDGDDGGGADDEEAKAAADEKQADGEDGRPTATEASIRGRRGGRFLRRGRRGRRRGKNDAAASGSYPGAADETAAPGESEDAPERQAETKDPREGMPLISDLLKAGQEVIVQISKEPLGKKGARITTHISLPGRFLVYMPTVAHVGVSRKIGSDAERARLRRVIKSNMDGLPGGFIVRTAGQGASDEELVADMRFLGNLWKGIVEKAEKRPAPALLHQDLDVVERILRDQLGQSYKTIWVDSEEYYESVLRFVERFQPELLDRVKLYTRSTPIFDEFNVTQEIEKALRPKVWLKSGGYIVINQTEALVAIDVNTGKYVGKSDRLEDTIVKTNLEAVQEVVRQMRLRDLGGIVVVDFIDMDDRANRRQVTQALENELRRDRAPSKALAFNDFGLIAITRKRVKQSIERALCSPCPACTGSGFVKSVDTVIFDLLREAQRIAAKARERKDVVLRVNPDVARGLKARDTSYLEELEELFGGTVLVRSDAALLRDQYDFN